MYKSLLISAAFCLFLFTSEFYCDPDLGSEKSSRNFDALPKCTEAMNQTETAAKLAKCPALSPTSNLSNPTDCCQYWTKFNCEKDILYTLPECNSSQFLIEMQVNLFKPANICLEPPASCANVTSNRAVTTVTENIFRPLTEILGNITKLQDFPNCANELKDDFLFCMHIFDALVKEGSNHSEDNICCTESDFNYCIEYRSMIRASIQTSTSCSPIKSEFDTLFTILKKNVAKKCLGTYCYRAGASTVSLTLPIIILSLVVALFARNV